MPDKTNNFARKAIRQIKHLLGDNRLAEEIRWRFKGKPSPPPGFVKQKILKTYAKNFALKTFVETGTGTGSTTWAMRNLFSKIYSVELNDELFKKAQIKFAAYPHVSLYQGDSAQILPSILTKINEPTLFWLDGHYSGESTSKGNLNTPILRELNLVLNHKIKKHIILIDDARCFVGKDDYPTANELEYFVKKINPKLNFEIQDDIIRIIY